MDDMNGHANGHNGAYKGAIPAYAPLGTVLDVDKPKRKSPRSSVKEEKIVLSAEDAKKQIGEQVAHLREFSNQLNEFLKGVQASISSGDFGPTTVEMAGELIDEAGTVKDSLEKIYDVALDRNYARLPPPRRKR